MGQPNLSINNGKETEFEFDVTIEGAATAKPSVRFVIEGVGGYDVTVNCEQRTAGKWLARVPPLDLHESVQRFRVEVVAGDFFFCPTSGAMKVVSNPRVSMNEVLKAVSAERPVVRAAVVREAAARAEPSRKLVVLENMTQGGRAELAKTSANAGRIFERAGEVLREGMTKQPALAPGAVASILDMVRNAMRSVEDKVYL